MLAAHYVMGTLHGSARVRFIKLMMQHPLLQETTWLWERRLNAFAMQTPPIAPSEESWKKIAKHLGF